MSVTYYDLETTSKTSFGREANPFDKGNWVVAIGWARDKGEPQGIYHRSRDSIEAGWFKEILNDTKMLVGFNLKFDILHSIQEKDNYQAYRKWVAEGGQIWDCQIAEYLLQGMTPESHYLSLNATSEIHGGTQKIDQVAELWAAGVDTPDINEDLLMMYLLGGVTEDGIEVLGDIGNTRFIFERQIAKARQQGQVKSIMLNMGSLLATIEMEHNGLFIDKPRGMCIAKELEDDIDALKSKLDDYLPADLPFEFKWTRTQLSALLFGGGITYEKRVHLTGDDGELLYSKKQISEPVLDDNGVPVFYKSGVNAGLPKTRKVSVDDLDKPKMRNEKFVYEFARMVHPKPQWETANEGVYSVAGDVIEELAAAYDIPFLKDFSSMMAKEKDVSTYYYKVDPKKPDQPKGMLTYVMQDGLVHHNINHNSTVTARFSSSKPNLQNIPKGQKSDVKTLCVSRFGKGSIVQSDFSSLEVYVQANLSLCKNLIADLVSGIDMHCMRLASKEHMPYEEVFKLCKIDELPEWDYKRTLAKSFSFQRAFGAGDAAIAAATGMDLEEVQALSAAEDARYPEIKEYNDNLAEVVKKSRIPTSKFVPHPSNPAIMCQIHRGYYQTPDGKLYSWQEHPSNEFGLKRGEKTSFMPTEMKNYTVQGTGAEFAKAAMWLAVLEFYKRDNFNGKAVLINQVHDALYLDAAEEVEVEASALLDACMTKASFFMEHFFKWDIKVKVPTDTTIGASMADEGSFDDPELFASYREGFLASVAYPF